MANPPRNTDVIWMSRRVSELFGRISATIDDWANDMEQAIKPSTTSPVSTASPPSAPPEQHLKQSVEPTAARTQPSDSFQRFVRTTTEVPWKKRHDGEKRKRVRVNWTPEENRALCDAVTRGALLSEDDLVTEIVTALSGSRTRFQAKGRFRNLLVSGRIRKSEDTPARWVVIDGALDKRRKRIKKDGELVEASDINDENDAGSGDEGSEGEPDPEAEADAEVDKGDVMDPKSEQA